MWLRGFILKTAGSKRLIGLVTDLARRSGLGRRFVAGETMEEGIAAVRELNARGVLATLNYLGEEVTDEREARRSAESYLDLLEAIGFSGIRSNVSVKLTQLGLRISRELCGAHLRMILDRAHDLALFVRIDMENSLYTQATIELFRQYLPQYRDNLGIAIQAYLYRSEQDLRNLGSLRPNIRLCKGAYQEPREVAFAGKREVDQNFLKLMEMLLRSPSYTAIATHDARLVDHARRFVTRHNLPRDRYEFQMIYGIGREDQKKICLEGHTMRVYVPFGTQWVPYFLRRLAERPANLLFLLRHLLRK